MSRLLPALLSLRDGSLVDHERWKHHALDALNASAAAAARLDVVDTTAENQLHELAFRVSTL